MLHGRRDEQARLRALLDGARRGRAGVLLLRGPAGVGKSELLADLLAGAGDDVQVLRAQGVESEFPLAFAGLHALLRPVPDQIDQLPAPQRRALQVAFGQRDGPPVEPFLVALATLGVLTEAAGTRPVLGLVDDAQWLDTASADALLFAARRLRADRVALVFAARDGDLRTFPADGIDSLDLGPLPPDAARAMLLQRLGTAVDEVVQVLLALAAGNPLALRELPTALTADQLAGTTPLPAQLPLTDGLHRVFLTRCRRLSEQAQTLLLVAAADDTGRVGVVRRAAAALGVGPEAFTEADSAGLLTTDGDVLRLQHPLLRSAVYQAATGPQRRATHQALARTLAELHDRDRQAWHQAAAVDGPDEIAVAALDGAAQRAERRGGYAAAAAGYERAAELTVDARAGAARRFAAARNAWAAGQPRRARTLLSSAADTDPDDVLLRADIDRLRGRLEVNVGSARNAHRIFQQAARTVATADGDRALEMAAAASVLRVYGADSGVRLDPATLDLRAAPQDAPRRLALTRLLHSMTLAADGRLADAVTVLRTAAAAGPEVSDPDVLGNLANAALYLGDDQTHLRLFTLMLSAGQDSGAGMTVLYALQRLPFSQLLTGAWAEARGCAVEAAALGSSIGQRALTAAPLAWLTLLDALQGGADYDRQLAELEQVVTGYELGILADPVHDLTRWAQGTRSAQHGDFAAALNHLRRLRLPVIQRMVAIDRIETAVRAGELEQATQWSRSMASFAQATGWPWAAAVADHGRALLAEPAEAPQWFERALRQPAEACRPYDRARTHLALGELLRRSNRRTEARRHLRAALGIAEDLRAEPLAERATAELRASGETARRRDPSALVALTPMELQVARLVAEGLSNKDVAARLWISPRTVAFHLRGAFGKLGVTSRGQLAHVPLA